MRTVLVVLTMLFVDHRCSRPIVIVARLLGVPKDGARRTRDACAHGARSIDLCAAGVEVVVHNAERIREAQARVFVANHVSWFDIFALAVDPAALHASSPRRSCDGSRCSAGPPRSPASFSSSATTGRRRSSRTRAAAQRCSAGASVVVYPEGTRGYDYQLRPFKKGPFVLAIAAQAPIVPTIVYGTREVMPKGSFRDPPGHGARAFPRADSDRRATTTSTAHELMRRVWDRMADAHARRCTASRRASIAIADARSAARSGRATVDGHGRRIGTSRSGTNPTSP